MTVRTWTSEAEIPRFKCFLSHSTVVWSWERSLQQFYCLVKEGRLIILASTVFLCMPPHPSAWEPLSDQVAVYSCRFNGSLPAILWRTPPPFPSIAQEPGSPSSLAEPTGMRTMRSVSDSLEVAGEHHLASKESRKKKGFLAYLDLQES